MKVLIGIAYAITGMIGIVIILLLLFTIIGLVQIIVSMLRENAEKK